MFVVRLKRPNEGFDFKAFASKKLAVVRLRAAQREMIDGDVEECALFDARTSDAEQAVEMVNQGKATLIESDLEDRRPRAPVRKYRRANSQPGKVNRRRAR
jgi:hypothetical protein